MLRDSWALPRAGGAVGRDRHFIKHAKATSTHHHTQQLWNRQHGAHAQGHRPMIVTVAGCNFGGMFCILLLLYAGSRSDNAFLVTLHRRVSTKWCRCRKVEEDTCRLDSCWFGIQVVLLLWRFRGTFVDVAIYAVGHWVAPEIFLWRCRQVHSCWMPCMRRALAARGRRLNMRLKVCRFAVSCASPEYIFGTWVVAVTHAAGAGRPWNLIKPRHIIFKYTFAI